MASNNPAQQPSFALAYLGDARYALWCRERVLQLNLGSGLTNQRVTQLVRCQTQARLLRHLLPLLTPAEQQVCRRGVNMKPLSPPRHASIRDYRQATGFECLVGYWHLSDRWDRWGRFEALMEEDALQEEFRTTLPGGTLQQTILLG